MLRLSLAVLAALLASATAAQDLPALGAPAPALAFSGAIGAPAGDLAGRARVVDFWATWCAPCVAAMPHLDSLAAEFAGQPVAFLAATDEDAETVRVFLARHPMAARVVLDADGAVASTYGVAFLPHTALIYADGRYAGFTEPRAVTAETVRALVAGDRLPVETGGAERAGWEPRPGAPSSPTASAVRVAYTDAPRAGYAWDTRLGTMSAVSVSLENLLRIAYDVPVTRLAVPDSLAGRSVAVEAEIPDVQFFEPVLQQALRAGLGLDVRREMQPREALVLRIAPGGPAAALRPSTQAEFHGGADGTALTATGARLADLAGALEWAFGVPVVDETALTGRYDVAVSFANLGEAPGAIARELGLTVTRETLPVEIIVVR